MKMSPQFKMQYVCREGLISQCHKQHGTVIILGCHCFGNIWLCFDGVLGVFWWCSSCVSWCSGGVLVVLVSVPVPRA